MAGVGLGHGYGGIHVHPAKAVPVVEVEAGRVGGPAQFSLDAPSQVPLTVECTFSAVLARMYLTSRPVRLLLACKSRAIAPDSIGAAEEEPLKVLV